MTEPVTDPATDPVTGSEPPSSAAAVRTYHEARFRGDVATAAAQLGPGFRFRSPFLTSDSPTGHLDGLDGLLSIVTAVDLISELYAEDRATLVYDVHTASPAGIQRTAEHFHLHQGRITAITLIFDSAPWQSLMAAAGPAAALRPTVTDPTQPAARHLHLAP
ncbi:hypothetical protein [Streptomyces sp. TLI_171]|uniref:hypothetical protein n=1 Tax=Streptomyces sp. TLI_171 TaxID=1938859 RepID=UPI000C56D49A|nr:hypothetical protein [Streptomyces sp. TLI_171]RKE22920.1 hypothetical protein BX266_6376 [Streptomyces sp. TLI_171]